ncbi:MAG: glycosyl hydrolase family 18 protein [Ignavibacteriaceae bacterium]
MIKLFLRKTNLLKLSILILRLLVTCDSVIAQQKVVGNYENWVNLPTPDKIEFKNLTHIVQAFASPNLDGSIGLPEGIPNPGLVNAVHSANEKILISFGGTGNSDGFVSMTSNTSSLDTFVSNVAFFLFINHYDGIDIDWEFPTFRQGGQLTALVKALRLKFDSLNPSWLITMAIPAGEYYGQNFQFK